MMKWRNSKKFNTRRTSIHAVTLVSLFQITWFISFRFLAFYCILIVRLTFGGGCCLQKCWSRSSHCSTKQQTSDWRNQASSHIQLKVNLMYNYPPGKPLSLVKSFFLKQYIHTLLYLDMSTCIVILILCPSLFCFGGFYCGESLWTVLWCWILHSGISL